MGLRSYGIYLFHWPVFVFWSPNDDGNATAVEWSMRIALALLLAEISYRLIEMPIRRHKIIKNHWVPTVLVGTATAVAVLAVTFVNTDPPVDRFELAEPEAFVPPTATASAGEPVEGKGTTNGDAAPPLIAVFGDSTAAAATDGLLKWSEESQLAFVQDISRPSCPISEYSEYRQSPAEPTHTRKSECHWRGKFGDWFEAYPPQIVVVIGGTSEIVDFETPDLGWTNVLENAGFEFVKTEFTALASELRASAPEATLVITTAPNNDWVMCQQPCLTHDPNRFDRYNEIVQQLVEQGTFDRSLDYGTHINDLELSPNDPMRPDGVHLSEDGSYQDAAWLGPAILDAVS